MKSLKALLGIFFISVLGFGVYQALVKSDFTRVKKIEIKGAQTQTEKRLRENLKIDAPHLWKLDTKSVAQTVQSDPWVEDVEIKKTFPDQVLIQVTERKPEAMVGLGSGSFQYVDKSGNIFGPAENKDLARHVLMAGKNMSQDKNLREQGLEIITQLPETGSLSKEDVSEIQFNGDKGFQVLLAKSGIMIDLGKENIPLHLDRARKVVQYLDQHKITATHVDADYAKKVLVKVRKGR